MRFFVTLIFTLIFGISLANAADERVEIIVDNETVKILNSDVFANCCSLYQNEININGNNIVLTQRDTSVQKCKCMCLFDLTANINNLSPGNYNLTILREELIKYGYYENKVYTIAKRKFTIDEGSKLPLSLKYTQSSCKVSSTDDRQYGQLSKEIEVYPNPASGRITIRFDLKENAEINIKILNLLGKEVLNQKNYGRQGIQTMTVESDLPPGVYIGKINTGNGQFYSFKVFWSK